MGEENNIFSGDCVLMMGNDVANLKPIGKVVENSVSVESEDDTDMLALRQKALQGIPTMTFSIDNEHTDLNALRKLFEPTGLKEANAMLERLENLQFLYRNKTTCRRERRFYKREYDKVLAMFISHCKRHRLELKRVNDE